MIALTCALVNASVTSMLLPSTRPAGVICLTVLGYLFPFATVSVVVQSQLGHDLR